MKHKLLTTASVIAFAFALVFSIITVSRLAQTELASSKLPPVLNTAKASSAPETATANEMKELPRDTFIAAGKAKLAPAFSEGVWINSDALTLESLRGRVVVVDFWTFGCYNCRNTLPALKDWDTRYCDQGLTIVGVHSPEFDREKNEQNVRRETKSLGINYAVVTDNDYATWQAYGVNAWPTVLVLDKQGRIRFTHVGEGAYDETENVIKKLLAE
ncbi:MAG: redoxin domain-containing protein [Pyrinomonadaceae bacterium]